MAFGTLVVVALPYISAQDWYTLPEGSPCGAKILKSVNKSCNSFLIHYLAEHDEIWQC